MASSVLTRLLQRTRASTFDPYVSQVYHTPIAHAVRGDFGGKRPLPPMCLRQDLTPVICAT